MRAAGLQIGDELCDLVRVKDATEGWHILAAIQDADDHILPGKAIGDV
jgi:hypothetical protein